MAEKKLYVAPAIVDLGSVHEHAGAEGLTGSQCFNGSSDANECSNGDSNSGGSLGCFNGQNNTSGNCNTGMAA